MSEITQRKLIALCILLLGLVAIYTGSNSILTRRQPRLAQIRARGYVRCGINGTLPHFSQHTAQVRQPEFISAADRAHHFYAFDAAGFDVDFCRAVAIAVFGSEAYEQHLAFIDLTAGERFTALVDGTIDVLFRNTTWTGGRDGTYPIEFGAVTYHTGQKFMVRQDDNISQLDQLAGRPVCVLSNTTTQNNLRRYFQDQGLALVEIDKETNEEVAGAFYLNQCASITSDEDQLLAWRQTQKKEERENYLIIPTQEAISYEPRGAVIAEGDDQWRAVVNYAVWATIYAEALGISKTNIYTYDESASLVYKQFLGLDDPAIQQHLGVLLGINSDFAQQIVRTLGNYGEIYTRHLGELIPERGLNQISVRYNPATNTWQPVPNHGLLFAPPFEVPIATTN